MAIKFDKDMILKHRFWIILGVAVILTLVGMLFLDPLGFSDTPGRLDFVKWQVIGKALTATQSLESIDTYKRKADELKGNETTVWSEAYKEQAHLFTWAGPVEKEFDFADGYFANEVKITKLDPAGKNWPADTDFLMHGSFLDQQDDWLSINTKKGPRKLFLTKNSENVLIVEENKKVSFFELIKHAPGKVLAVGFQRGKYFADLLTANESRMFKTTYKDQIHTILKSVDPLDEKMNGVVQFKGWLYTPDALPHEAAGLNPVFIRYVKDVWPQVGADIDKEAWIAQEDLWIQQEIYRMIRVANDSVSNFKPLFKGKNDERNKAYAFQNSYFDLELTLDKNDTLSFKIKNRLNRQQSIDLSFRVLLNDAKKGFKEEVIKVSGLPLQPAGTKDKDGKARDTFVKTYDKGKEERAGVYSVQQVLNWQTAAVKRIDQISIGSIGGGNVAHAQRTFPVTLRPFDEKDMAEPADKGGAIGPIGPGGIRPKVIPGKKGLPFGPGPGQVGPIGAGNAGPLEMGLWTHRYVEVTDQARRLPVAVVLIVDQDHVDRVLTAFNNSNLRFLETQVLLNQFSGSLQPPAPADKIDAGAPPQFPGIFPRGPGVGPVGPGFGPKGPELAGGAGDLETNMELVIYGIMTLYQRYPPRPALAPAEKKQ